jgi:Ca2+-transporting ATPase
MSVESLYCDGITAKQPGSSASWAELLRAMALSNDVSSNSNDRTLGDPTEVALFEAANREGARKSDLERDYPRIGEIPFDSDRKRMTTFHRNPTGGVISFTKGAVESVLERSIRERSGENNAILDSTTLLQSAEEMASNGLRVIAFAVRYWPDVPSPLTVETAESELQFLGLAGIGDPVREEVRDAVAMCKKAGITPIMITGDHPLTARAVGKSLGILTDSDEVVTGREISAMSSNSLVERARTARVYARVAPEQKLNIVRALQSHGHIVAMTGDGVNDAPALKQAEIGVAMGIAGTGVAKEASAMILLDDNFASIVRAVREGRRIYDNLRRFVRYAITTNASEVWIMFFAPLLGLPIPLLPFQILWVNLITDGLPGLALAAEPEETHLMTRPPRPPNESVFAHGLGFHSLWVGILMAALVLGVQAVAIRRGSSHWQTMVLSVMAFSQLAHALAIRSERESLFKQGMFSNKPLVGAITLTIVLQLAVIYLHAANSLFNTLPLTLMELGMTVMVSGVIFFAVEGEKLLKRRRNVA